MMKSPINKNKSANHINASIYSIVEAVNSSVEPGEEELVPWIVKHILETRSAEVTH